HLLVEGIGADVADRGLHRVGLALATPATAPAALVAAAEPARLLHAALVVGLLQRVRNRAVLGDLAPRLPRLADGAAIEGLLQRIGNRREIARVMVIVSRTGVVRRLAGIARAAIAWAASAV